MLLTRAPLSTGRNQLHVRLACVRPAASVRSEPGSNSHVDLERLGKIKNPPSLSSGLLTRKTKGKPKKRPRPPSRQAQPVKPEAQRLSKKQKLAQVRLKKKPKTKPQPGNLSRRQKPAPISPSKGKAKSPPSSLTKDAPKLLLHGKAPNQWTKPINAARASLPLSTMSISHTNPHGAPQCPVGLRLRLIRPL